MRPLRAYLLTLVIGVVLPMFILATAQAVGSAVRQRAAIEAGLVYTSRALATAVECELQRGFAALNVLAASPRLDAGDVAGFHDEARASMGQMPWFTVWLADAQGHQIVNVPSPVGSPLPSLDGRPYLQDALRSGKPAVSGIVVGGASARPMVMVVVPRLRNGKLAYLVGASLRPETFDRILASVNQQFHSATASVIDRDFLLVARNRDAAQWVGKRAHQDYIDSLGVAPEGVSRTRTLEGHAVYASYHRLPASGWTVGMGVLASEVERPLRTAWWTSGLIGGSAMLLAGTLAVLLSRRISEPIKALAATAQGIALGRHGPVPEASAIAEIATLGKALQYAAQATFERDRLAEHARHIAGKLEAAEIRERQQIARDLHDDLAQTLAVALIRLARLQAHADPEVARVASELAELVGRADRSTRSLAAQLSPPVLYELGLVPALEWLAQQIAQDYDLAVDIQDDGEPKPLSTESAAVVFRCVRELLINVAKHAQSDGASVTLMVENAGVLAIHVVDGGLGIDSISGRQEGEGQLGLLAVRERVAHLGGTFEVGALPGGGTEATLRIPLQAPAVR